jgi:signal transduction histidine kinase
MPRPLLRPPRVTWRSALLCGPLLLLIWMGLSAYESFRVQGDRRFNADRIFLVLGTSTELLAELQDAESGQRGYLLTGNESYLAPYLAANAKIDANFQKLEPAASVIPGGLERLAHLRLLSDAKRVEMQQTIDLFRSGGQAAALRVVEDDTGQNYMTQLRTEFNGLIRDSFAARGAQRTAAVGASRRTMLVTTLGAVALFLMLAFATTLIERDQLKQGLDALQIQELNQTLENKVAARTRALRDANGELEAFCYSVSHDLRAPLRSVEGFAKILERDYADKPFDARAHDLMHRMSASSVRMGQLIDDLLNLSRIARGGIAPLPVDLSAVAASVEQELAVQNPGRTLDVSIAPDLRTQGDERLLRVALENLFGNAWKFTRNEARPHLEFGQQPDGGAFFVRDNGVGFDMAYSQQLFVPFQRLHSDAQFEGTGIGLATVQRVIQSHGGRIWAESIPGSGATFFFTIQTERRRTIDGEKIDSHGGGQPGRRVAHA